MIRLVDAETNLSSAELPRKTSPVRPVGPGAYNTVKKRLLLPESARHPLAVLAICVLPQIVLLAINFSAWQLGSAEMSPSEILTARQIFITQLIALGAGVGLSGWLFARKQLLSRWQGLITLLPSLAFLATVVILAERPFPPQWPIGCCPRNNGR